MRDTIWNVDVQGASLHDILDAIDGDIAQGKMRRTLFCANPHSLVVAERDGEFLSALRAADYLIPDGAGIVLASRILRGGIMERVTGSDILRGVAGRWDAHGAKSFFFLGSTAAVLERVKERMAREYPRVAVAGVYSPSFGDALTKEENAAIVEKIQRAAPTALWVGMTAPKQEKWIRANLSALPVPFIAAIGAAFDYFAGTKQRASESFQRAGLEWLPRLLREPGRMWRRNFVSTPLFLYHVMLQRLGSLPARS